MALTNMAINKAKPKDKPYKLHDSDGLYLQINPSGSKIWKFDYRLLGKRGTYTIGPYPDHSLKDAREKLIDARKLVANGENPTRAKKVNKAKQALNEKRFSEYAKEWIEKQHYAESTLVDMKLRLEKNIYPTLDSKPVDQFNTLELYNLLKEVSDRGARETAKRLANTLRQIFDELLTFGLITSNPAQGLSRILPKPDHRQKGNFAHLRNPENLAILLNQIHSPNISKRQDPIVTYALKFMPLVFLRPRNIRYLKWSFISFTDRLITFPAAEMKTAKEHKVPLSNQAIEILREVQKIRGMYEYVFVTRYGRPNRMSENTTTAAIKRLVDPRTGKPFGTGFMTSHGFRHTASTLLNELGYNPVAVSLQMSHLRRNKVDQAYNKSELLPERTVMMQGWADYIDGLLEK